MLAGLVVGLLAALYINGGLSRAGAWAREVAVGQGFVRKNRPRAGAYYSGCNEARAAGVAPLYAGEPGYRDEMDGDGDGVACEPYRGRK
jgi:Excalibur calcium-binding domain